MLDCGGFSWLDDTEFAQRQIFHLAKVQRAPHLRGAERHRRHRLDAVQHMIGIGLFAGPTEILIVADETADDESWIVLDEANEFFWPEVDLRPVSRSKPGVWTFEVLPREVFGEIQAKFRMALPQRRTRRND